MSGSSPIETFQRLLADQLPLGLDGVVSLIGVSGGADSVALLRGLASRTEDPQHLIVAHFNHALRPESGEDQQFVSDLCVQLGLSFEAARSEVPLSDCAGGQGLEAAARSARYAFFRDVASRVGARYLALAHTADDQAETILHRIVRGTGISGLAGIPRIRPLNENVTLIRPLLSVTRLQVEAYLQALGQPYRQDATNNELDFTRNRIRHELLPLLESQYHPQARAALLRLGALAAEAQELIDAQVSELFNRCVHQEADSLQLDADVLAHQPRYLVRELFIALWKQQGWPLQAMGYQQWDALAELTQQTTQANSTAAARQTLPGNVDAIMQPSGILQLTGPNK